MSVQRVVVTGGKGFLGRATCEKLALRRIEAIPVDRERDIVHYAIPRADAVIHLAGVLGTEELFTRANEAIDVNIKGTLKVLDACETYGMRYVGITMPDVWPNVYQATKQCARTLATAWHQNYGVPVSHVRAFNAFGVGQKYGMGHPRKIIPTFATAAWLGVPIPVNGDGTQTVDLVWSDDVAEMLVRALAFGDDEVFDAGTGESATVLEVAELVRGVAKSSSELRFLPMRKGEVPHTELVAKGEGWDLMGWHPPMRSFALAETIYSYR